VLVERYKHIVETSIIVTSIATHALITHHIIVYCARSKYLFPQRFVQQSGSGSGAYEAIANRFQSILEVSITHCCFFLLFCSVVADAFTQVVQHSFAQAAAEPKLTSRDELLQRNAAVVPASVGTVDVVTRGSGARGECYFTDVTSHRLLF
jgi:hypothetical protein